MPGSSPRPYAATWTEVVDPSPRALGEGGGKRPQTPLPPQIENAWWSSGTKIRMTLAVRREQLARGAQALRDHRGCG